MSITTNSNYTPPRLTKTEFDLLTLAQKDKIVSEAFCTVEYHFMRRWMWHDALSWYNSTDNQGGFPIREMALDHCAYAICTGAIKPRQQRVDLWNKIHKGKEAEEKKAVQYAIKLLKSKGYHIHTEAQWEAIMSPSAPRNGW